jgi:hypothetical protein
MKRSFSNLVILSLFTCLIMSVITNEISAQVKNILKKNSVATSPVKYQSNIKSDIVKPPLPVLEPLSTVNCYPVNASRNTGSVNSSGTITQTSLIKSIGDDNFGSGEQGWIKFNISSIPPGVTILNVDLNFYVNNSNNPYFYVNQVISDPLTASGSALYSEITGAPGKYFDYNNNYPSLPPGWTKLTLNTSANTDIQGLLSQGWWAAGFYENDGAPAYYFWADGWNETNKPYITVTYFSGTVIDAQTTALWMPTRVPIISYSPFAAQNIPWTSIVKNNGTNPATFNVNTGIYKNTIRDALFVSAVTGLTTGSTQTFSGNYNVTSSANYNLSNTTLLSGDLNPVNDSMYYTFTCAVGVNDSVYAWDNGTPFSAIGLGGGVPCWFGSIFTLSAPDTLTSATVCWGYFGGGTITGNTVELWNTSGGIPTSLNSTIANGISLSAADNYTLKTYMAPLPVVLSAGTYFIAVHQTVTQASTFIMGYDNGPTTAPWTSVTSPRNISYYSSTGTSWSETYSMANYDIFMTRANFGMIPPAGPAVVTTTAPTGITTTTATSGGNVLNEGTSPVTSRGVCWNTSGNPTVSDPKTINGNGLGVFTSNITGLTGSTIYHVRTYATNTSGTSYGNDIQFTTGCATAIAPIIQDFEPAVFPPDCWTLAQTDLSYPWARVTAVSGYGIGAASAYVNFFNAPESRTMDMISNTIDISGLSAPLLKFDHAYATYSGDNDQLEILYSVNDGSNYMSLIIYDGGTSGPLNTGGSTSDPFVPSAGQWATKSVNLPAGTNKLKFHAISAYGNNLYIDNIKVVAGLGLGLTALLSGNYNGTTMIPKNVTVELHNATTPYALVESKTVTLDANGLSYPVYTTAVNGTPYYIVLKFNNGLETWSAAPQTFSGSTLIYNFTTAATQAFGSNMLLVGTKWCIISGDVNQDGSVDALDRSVCWNDRNLSGVYASDLNGDGTVDALDRSIAWNNRNLSVQKPALVLSPMHRIERDNKRNTKGTLDLRLDGSNSKKVTKTK